MIRHPIGWTFWLLYNEPDPFGHISPAIGKLIEVKLPEENKHIRIDSGIQTGDTISPYYDPLLAKLIVWDHTRDAAMQRLKTALSQSALVGIDTNIGFLYQVCDHPDFQQMSTHTGFIEQHRWPSNDELPTALHTAAATAIFNQQQQHGQRLAEHSSDTTSPWFLRDHWRLYQHNIPAIHFWHHDKPYAIKPDQADCDLIADVLVLVCFSGVG